MREEDRKRIIRELTQAAGRARLTSMTAKERSRVAKLGAEARWNAYRVRKKAEVKVERRPKK